MTPSRLDHPSPRHLFHRRRGPRCRRRARLRAPDGRRLDRAGARRPLHHRTRRRRRRRSRLRPDRGRDPAPGGDLQPLPRRQCARAAEPRRAPGRRRPNCSRSSRSRPPSTASPGACSTRRCSRFRPLRPHGRDPARGRPRRPSTPPSPVSASTPSPSIRTRFASPVPGWRSPSTASPWAMSPTWSPICCEGEGFSDMLLDVGEIRAIGSRGASGRLAGRGRRRPAADPTSRSSDESVANIGCARHRPRSRGRVGHIFHPRRGWVGGRRGRYRCCTHRGARRRALDGCGVDGMTKIYKPLAPRDEDIRRLIP